jgi:hypothetical protein
MPSWHGLAADDRRDDVLYQLSVRFRETHNAWVAELERCRHALLQSSALLPDRYDPYPCHVGQRAAPAKRKSFLQNVLAGVDTTAQPFVQGVIRWPAVCRSATTPSTLCPSRSSYREPICR